MAASQVRHQFSKLKLATGLAHLRGCLRMARRTMANSTLGLEMAAPGNLAAVPAVSEATARLGGWASCTSAGHNTLRNTYVAQTAENLCSQLTHAATGRVVHPRMAMVRQTVAAGEGGNSDEHSAGNDVSGLPGELLVVLSQGVFRHELLLDAAWQLCGAVQHLVQHVLSDVKYMPNSGYRCIGDAVRLFFKDHMAEAIRRGVAVHDVGLSKRHWQLLQDAIQGGHEVPVCLVQFAWFNLVHHIVHHSVVGHVKGLFGVEAVAATGLKSVADSLVCSASHVGGVPVSMVSDAIDVMQVFAGQFLGPKTETSVQGKVRHAVVIGWLGCTCAAHVPSCDVDAWQWLGCCSAHPCFGASTGR